MGEKFIFPSNVKQIGSIDDDMKIYVEDYAYTYICQYARSEAYKEKLAVLVGKHIKAEGKNVVLISGVIQSKYSENVGGNQVFTEETWEYINTRKERYFKGTEIVGWLHTQPGNGVYIPEEDKVFHKQNFPEAHQLLFVMDCTERMDAFFVWDNKIRDLKELGGYFIYYDKNDNMQEYMLDNKLVKSRSYNYKEEEEEEEKDGVKPKEDFVVNYRRNDKQKKAENHQKKLANLLVGTSGIVVMLCFFMGLLLLQNAQRMNKLEQELLTVNKVYKEIFADDSAAPVFASQEDDLSQKQSEPSKEEEAIVLEQETKQLVETTQATQSQTQVSTQVAPPAETKPVETKPAQTKPAETKPVEKATVPVATKKSIPQTHKVESGDTLSWISTYYYGTNRMVQNIMDYNNIKDANKVYEGMVLKLPPN